MLKIIYNNMLLSQMPLIIKNNLVELGLVWMGLQPLVSLLPKYSGNYFSELWEIIRYYQRSIWKSFDWLENTDANQMSSSFAGPCLSLHQLPPPSLLTLWSSPHSAENLPPRVGWSRSIAQNVLSSQSCCQPRMAEQDHVPPSNIKAGMGGKSLWSQTE